MDLESRRRWEEYTVSKERMFERTSILEAPWWVVEGVDKKRARLNCISHFLDQIPYRRIERQPVDLPPRRRNEEYERKPIPTESFVPKVY